MEQSWKTDLMEKLKKRNKTEVLPFTDLFEMHNKILEQNINLKTENSSLNFITEKLKEENLHLKSKSTSENSSHNNEDFLELQKKLFNVQEELTEMHRRKGENAQQVIDLSAALKVSDKDLIDKQLRIDSLEAEIISLKDDLKTTEAQMAELESTNQLLKDEYQALQLALNSSETKLRTIQRENETLVTQLMALKAQDAERMNFENDQFIQKQQQLMQIELAEAAKEQKSISPEKQVMGGMAMEQQVVFTGVTIPTKAQIKFEAHDGEIMSARWDYAGRYFATAGADRKIKIWEISKGISAELKSTLTGSNAAVMGIDFDTSGTIILGSSNDFATRVWTIDDCRLRHTLTGHSGKVLSAKFLGDATRVVSGSHDRTLKVWDLRSKACICTKFAGSSCNDLVTSDQVIISGHFDKKVRLWDNRSSSSEPMSEMVVGGKVSSLDLSRDLNMLAVCSRDDKIQILDLRKGGGVVGTVGGEGFHVGCDWSRVSLSPSAEEVVGGGGEGGVHIWNIASGKSEGVLRGHSSTVAAVCWHPGGGNIVSVDKTKTCVVWA